MKEKFILIDASAIIHRAFHALPPLTTRSGELVNAVYGFCLILLKILNELKPDYIAVAFDSPKPTFRHKEFKEYKAKRIKKGEELYGQFPKIKQVLEAFSIPLYEIEGYEADDIIASLKSKISNLKSQNLETIIVTGDLDTLQLVDQDTRVYGMRKGLTDLIVYDKNKVLERYGFNPASLADFKGLAGDPSDNIPGVPGIGEKVAGLLIKKYNSMESVYQKLNEQPERVRRALETGKESALLSKSLATLANNLPVKFDLKKSQFKGYDVQKVVDLFYQFDFKSLISRLKGGPATLPGLFEKEVKTKADEIDQKLEPVLREMEKTGVKIDVPYLEKLSKSVEKQIQELKSQIFQKTGSQFNLDSPLQLSQILFTRLGLEIRGIKKTKTGISTAAAELLKLRHSHPVIDSILKYRELSKLKNTYLDTLPKMADKNSRIHTTYTQDTQTGRLASKNPNLQNIPIKTELGRKIRRAFVTSRGFKLVAADYSQIELRIVAHLSGEPRLITAFKKGLDIHEAVCQALKIERRVAKAINFGIIYGMSAHGLSETLGISHQEAQNYIDRFFDLHPKLRLFIENCIGKARQKGFIESLFGRRRYLPEINSPMLSVRSAAERMAINMPCQGSSADILKLAMIELNSRLRQGFGGQAKLILTVHDELVFEVPEEKVKEAAKIIKEAMENVVKLDVPLKIELGQGKNWGELTKLKVKN